MRANSQIHKANSQQRGSEKAHVRRRKAHSSSTTCICPPGGSPATDRCGPGPGAATAPRSAARWSPAQHHPTGGVPASSPPSRKGQPRPRDRPNLSLSLSRQTRRTRRAQDLGVDLHWTTRPHGVVRLGVPLGRTVQLDLALGSAVSLRMGDKHKTSEDFGNKTNRRLRSTINGETSCNEGGRGCASCPAQQTRR